MAFDASQYLKKVNGGDYLEVKWRLKWLREAEPEASLVTELVQLTDDLAVFRCTITLPSGVSATGYGSESPADFRDYIEKAETKAIGRACAALGFGTQFAPEFEDGPSGRIADSPIGGDGGGVRQMRRSAQRGGSQPDAPATDKQKGFLWNLAKHAGMDKDALEAWCVELIGAKPGEMTRAQISEAIDELQALVNATA